MSNFMHWTFYCFQLTLANSLYQENSLNVQAHISNHILKDFFLN